MKDPRIELLVTEYKEIRGFFEETEQISYQNYINNIYKKTLLLSVASYFETLIVNIITSYVRVSTNNDTKTITFIEKKALNRQYYTLFEWDVTNANKFFSCFGDDAKRCARALIEERNLSDAEHAFMTIGRERNKLVHNNFIYVPLDNFTFEDIYKLYEVALKFIDIIQEVLPSR